MPELNFHKYFSVDLTKGVFGHSSTFYAIQIQKTSKFEINVTSTLDHVLTTSLPRSKNSRTWRGRGQNETISDF